MSSYKQKIKTRRNKKWITILAIVVVLAIGLYLLWRHHHVKLQPTANQNSTSQNANSSKSSGTHTLTSTPGTAAKGGVTDQLGQTNGSSLPPASQWTTSSTGKITLQTPVANSTVVSGDKLIGTSSTKTVDFVLLDDKVGQIAQGELSVVNGKFAGTLGFTAHAITGELDVYSPNPNNGAEENFLSITVKF